MLYNKYIIEKTLSQSKRSNNTHNLKGYYFVVKIYPTFSLIRVSVG